MPFATSTGSTLLLEAAEVRVHDVERHLHGVEAEAVLGRHLEHAQVDQRIFVAGEADEADLARLLRRQHGLHGAALGEDAVGVFQADDLVELHEVDDVGLQPLEATRRSARRPTPCVRPSILVIRKTFAVAVAQRLAHADLALAVVVVPAVVQEGDAAIDGGADEPDALLLVLLAADVMTAEADDRDFLAGAPSVR